MIWYIHFFFLLIHKQKSKSRTGIGLQVWFQNARAKFRRNVLRQENGAVDKADGASLPPPSSDSGAMTPPSSAATLTELTNPSITVVTSVTSSLDSHDSGSPSQTTLTNLFPEHLSVLSILCCSYLVTLLFCCCILYLTVFTTPALSRTIIYLYWSLVSCSKLLCKWYFSLIFLNSQWDDRQYHFQVINR